MKVFTVVGARPQFVKAAPVARALTAAGIEEVLVHTGQHYDFEMSQVFFDELQIPAPRHHLAVGSGNHGQQTGAMLATLENVMVAERPDAVLVYGDTNSTLAGALCAAKLHVPVAHVEAGLRSFNRKMPEEINRIVADHLSQLLFCPSRIAVDNLAREGITEGVSVVGDVMLDVLREALRAGESHPGILSALGLEHQSFLLATIHRAETTDDAERLSSVIAALGGLEEQVIFPAHPRTRSRIQSLGLELSPRVRMIEPVGYVDMVRLERNARMILTDSGGVQKEAYWLGVPCVTMRTETEWVETVENGWNVIVGSDREAIVRVVADFRPSGPRPSLYGDGHSAGRVADALSALPA